MSASDAPRENVQIAAAKLRATLDQRLSRVTPPEVIEQSRLDIMPSDPNPATHDRGVQIAAAKLRCTLDREFGRVTPQWVIDLANETK
jgi:hypothetical protein